MVLASSILFIVKLFFYLISVWSELPLQEGDSCRNNNVDGESEGRCLSAYECPWALQQIQKRQTVDTCNFNGKVPIVCCPLNQINNENNSTSTPTSTPKQTPTDITTGRTTFEEKVGETSIGTLNQSSVTCSNYNPNGGSTGICVTHYYCSWALDQIRKNQEVDTCNFVNDLSPMICCPMNRLTDADISLLNSIAISRRSQIIAQKDSNERKFSQSKCLEYYPPSEGSSFATGGTKSLAEEFPHMAVLGFGEVNDIQWKCGGSLISLQHVLTAAHCLYSRDFGVVKYVRLGDLNIAIDTDPAVPQDFNVKRTIFHPNYDSGTVKNDIAIIELDKPVQVTRHVKPACMFAGGDIDPNAKITATGWGVTEFSGNPSDHLLKVALKIVSKDDCKKQYMNTGSRGDIDDARQVCAGSADDEKLMDTCQGDSGGPLQMTFQSYHHIIGITSFGKACGITKSAGVYTRLSFHLHWVESSIQQLKQNRVA